ncbi:2-oxoglutarate dehydrogenase E1 component [Alicyclobacillus fastidiosus]|uniref:oxoglutarate dehydrogenase (succinyl-transferring) n=1 Tax=Alicyclobacillus fastidiosus TaxID=392011 RepID=A0ABY6ZL60_9BACL|nr:2-oxoglutarate dehydrogenase E1 component [Alicyclobacillus fastidiosus]WAH43606.1 2-oxoglutarate dehydrogenase E1 component [Alicyclobacillus fastidiosus]
MENEHPSETQSFWQQFFGPNFGYILELYESYRENPESVSADTRALFATYGDPNTALSLRVQSTQTGQAPFSVSPERIAQVIDLARSIRVHGHLAAATDPLHPKGSVPQLETSTHGIGDADLSELPASVVLRDAPADVRSARDAIDRLRQAYCGRHGYEFQHLTDETEIAWLQQQVESGRLFAPLSSDEKKELYASLAKTELFEKFMHRRFVGQKRFSVEGLDALVPVVQKVTDSALEQGISTVVIGMAHRGRLNVLAHVVQKPYERIFSEFHAGNNFASEEEMQEYELGWGGDVKYHQGWRHEFQKADGSLARIILANNPSHLEVANPVVEGIARAAQEDRTNPGLPQQDVTRAIPVVIHGDAAFPGEGVVTETLNFSQIPGYYTGGTVHIIANNHVGFTADPEQGRSTRYASDPAKGYEIPIVHVSADDPEACLAAARLAFLYRETFHKDFLIDLIGYRRWGHNETDDPSMTQPVLYTLINERPTVKALYGEQLQAEGVLSSEQIASVDSEISAALMEAFQKLPDMHHHAPITDFSAPQVEVSKVSLETLREMNQALLQTPEDFTTYPKLKRILERRTDAIDNGDIDWAHAEALAFATILQAGTPIRLTGQDSERGTFGQRHLVLHDVNDGHKYTPLQHLPGAQASFIVYNSPLSETGVIGFEYGYNVEAPETLVLWEAQFGDFANVAQPMIDQFIAAGRAKWAEASGLVLLLPHGYEGQASEHSSARVERFLQLAAKNNLFIANVTSSAQYFHLLRLQAARLGKNARPLVVMTPKSLLRNVRAASKGIELAEGQFQTVLHQPSERAKKVTRLVLSSGKVGVDLTTEIEKRGGDFSWLATARVEQLYPFPAERIQEILAQYANLREVVWLQEEPQNAGAWSFVVTRLLSILPANAALHYVGRPEQAFPAEGSPDVHNAEQAHILDVALSQQTL